MSFISKLIKTGIRAGVAKKVIDVARREAAKPENQEKAREAMRRLQEKRRQRRDGKAGS